MNNQTNEVQLNTGSSKKLWIIVGASVLLTALIVGGGVYAWQRAEMKKAQQALQQQVEMLQLAQEAAPTPTETPRPTAPTTGATTKTYTNTYGYQVQVPATWGVFSAFDGEFNPTIAPDYKSIVIGDPQTGTTAQFEVFTIAEVGEKEGTESFIDWYTGFRLKDEQFQRKQMTIGRESGYEFYVTSRTENALPYVYLVERGDTLFALAFNRKDAVVEQILSSFSVDASAVLDMGAWQTYRADQGFSFKHPADWIASKSSTGFAPADKIEAMYGVRPRNVQGDSAINFIITSRPLADEVSYQEQLIAANSNQELISSDKNITLSRKGHHFFIRNRSTGLKYSMRLVEYSGKTLIITPFVSDDEQFAKITNTISGTLTLP